LVELDAEGKRIAVLGEMRELGTESERGHREVGETVATLGVNQLITIGNAAEMIAEGARIAGLDKVLSVGSTGEAARLLGEIAEPGDLILIKGSRAARTEKVIEQFGSQDSAVVNSP
jgi:UDP-N-acetylmuramyl pentapeptide synthase